MEFNDEQLAVIKAKIKESVDAAVADKDTEIASLKQHNSTLIGEQRAANERVNEVTKTKIDKDNDIEAARTLIETLQGEVKTLKDERKAVNFDKAILEAVNGKNIHADFREDLTDLVRFRAKYDDETGVTTVNEKGVSEYLDEFLSSERGQRYVPASPASGGGSTGSTSTQRSTGMTRDTFNADRFYEMPTAERNAWAVQNNMSHLKDT